MGSLEGVSAEEMLRRLNEADKIRRKEERKKQIIIFILLSIFLFPIGLIIYLIYYFIHRNKKKIKEFSVLALRLDEMPKNNPLANSSSNATDSNFRNSDSSHASQHKNFGFIDGCGNYVESGNIFRDGRGNICEWGSNFYDAKGNYVEGGSPFYDSRGNLCEEGSPFYDTDGNLIDPS